MRVVLIIALASLTQGQPARGEGTTSAPPDAIARLPYRIAAHVAIAPERGSTPAGATCCWGPGGAWSRFIGALGADDRRRGPCGPGRRPRYARADRARRTRTRSRQGLVDPARSRRRGLDASPDASSTPRRCASAQPITALRGVAADLPRASWTSLGTCFARPP